VRRAAMDFFSLLFVGAAARETVIWFEVFAAVGARYMENTHKHTLFFVVLRQENVL
jgi:hypothetical protein